ncbi:DUF2971 domain-containing protein [Sphingomonas sp. Leaf21]|uniref:DUF2971 domain-containing protein n=1 Tax=Sphingomonas sp. Leaf21 TaxID=2876550 RepID=UPI001E4F9648|nr:DUF2971 domain-containing protein [Sphingomonas sp. Leaf21]
MAICFVVLTRKGYADIRVCYDGSVLYYGETGEAGEPGAEIVLEGIQFNTEQVPPFTNSASVMIVHNDKIVDGIPPTPGPIYHYTNILSAKSIVESGQLRLSPFAKANDDRERQSWWFDVACKDHTAPGLMPIDLSLELSKVLKEPWSFASFSKDTMRWDEEAKGKLDASGWKQPSMWAHYSRRHQTFDGSSGSGAVLVFDRRELLHSLAIKYDNPIIMGDIVYFSDSNSLNVRSGFVVNYDEYNATELSLYAGAHLKAHWRSLFLTKYDGWSHEAETRLMINTPHGQERSAPIIPALKEIIIGEGATESEVEGMRTALSGMGSSQPVTISQARWRNGLPIKLSLS